MQLGPEFETLLGSFQTVLGFQGCSTQLPARVLLDTGSALRDSTRTTLKKGPYGKYGALVPASYFDSLVGLRLIARTQKVLVLNATGKERLRHLTQVTAAGVHASDSL